MTRRSRVASSLLAVLASFGVSCGNSEPGRGSDGGLAGGGSGGDPRQDGGHTGRGGTDGFGGAGSGGRTSGTGGFTGSGGRTSGGGLTASGGRTSGIGGLTASGGRTSGVGGATGSGGRATSRVLRVEGRFVVDTCGSPFVARGMEQHAATAFSADGTLGGIVEEIAKTGSNAVRILPSIDELSVADLDAMLDAFAAERIVVYISPGDRSWFLRESVRAMLLEHEAGIVIDAFQEPDYWDVPRWVDDVKASIATIRDGGYSCPLTVLSNGFGRDLPAALENGQEIFDSDPLRNTIVGWQAYWGSSGWYQGQYGMSLEEGVAACAEQGFPMQIGIDLFADPGEEMDYSGAMAAAEEHAIGWLWWDWWNQWDSSGNNASHDGTYVNLTEVGETVVNTDPNSIRNTAVKACFE